MQDAPKLLHDQSMDDQSSINFVTSCLKSKAPRRRRRRPDFCFVVRISSSAIGIGPPIPGPSCRYSWCYYAIVEEGEGGRREYFKLRLLCFVRQARRHHRAPIILQQAARDHYHTPPHANQQGILFIFNIVFMLTMLTIL